MESKVTMLFSGLTHFTNVCAKTLTGFLLLQASKVLSTCPGAKSISWAQCLLTHSRELSQPSRRGRGWRPSPRQRLRSVKPASAELRRRP